MLAPTSISSSDAGSGSGSGKLSLEFHGRKALRAIVIAAVLCVLLDLLLHAVLPAPAQRTYYSTARAQISRSAAPDIQIVGDSVVNQGLLASALMFGEDVWVRNDGLNGTRLPFTYYLLRRQFENGQIPRVLVISHTPSFNDPQIGKLTRAFVDWKEIPAVASATTHYVDALYGVISRSSYFLGNRDAFRQLLTQGDFSPFQSGADTAAYQRTPEMALLDAYQSDNAVARGPGRFGELWQVTPFQVDEDVDWYFRGILALAKQHGVKVYWLTMPIPEVVNELNQLYGIEANLLAYLEPFQARGDITILQGPFMVYPDETFQDIVHMMPSATVKFSCHARTLAPLLADATEARQPLPPSAERAAMLREHAVSRKLLEELCDSQDARR